jgi:signal transduction histidine kinase
MAGSTWEGTSDKDVIIAIISESRTPIDVIKQFSRALLDGHLGALNDEQRHSITVILNYAQQLEELRSTALDYLRYSQEQDSRDIARDID